MFKHRKVNGSWKKEKTRRQLDINNKKKRSMSLYHVPLCPQFFNLFIIVKCYISFFHRTYFKNNVFQYNSNSNKLDIRLCLIDNDKRKTVNNVC